MSLNCIEIEEIVKSFPAKGIISAFRQNTKNELVMSVFDGTAHFTIQASILDNYNRICLVPAGKTIKGEKLRFSQALEAALSSARIEHIYHYHLSRIVCFRLLAGSKTFFLIFRLWGRSSNILLTDEQFLIIDCLRRYPKMDEWPDDEFVFPEKQDEGILKTKYAVRDEFARDINTAVYNHYNTILETIVLDRKKRELNDFLGREAKKFQHVLDTSAAYLETGSQEKYKKYGELITASIWQIKKGASNAELTDYETGKKLTVSLKPDLSPAENAERYFVKYKKIKEGRVKWLEQRDAARENLALTNSYMVETSEAACLEELVRIEEKVYVKRKSKKGASQVKQKLPGRIYTLFDRYTAFVSRSSKEADQLLKRVARGNDYWFHIRDYAGSHVVVKCRKGKELPEKTRLQAAMLALHFSKAKGANEGDIYFTRVKYLHKPNTGTPGLVFPTQEKNIKVRKDEVILKEILDS